MSNMFNTSFNEHNINNFFDKLTQVMDRYKKKKEKNDIAAFTCTGISSFNRNIFTSADVAPSSVTDRPLQVNNEILPTAFAVLNRPELELNNPLDDHSIASNDPESPQS